MDTVGQRREGKALDYEAFRMRHTAILGGTFNPVHIGHLGMARNALQEFDIDRVIFLPVGNPPHKAGVFVASREDRYRMLMLATREDPRLEVSRLEIEREGYTYTVDTLQILHREYPSERFSYIIGADTLFELPTWKDFPTVAMLCQFLVFLRRGHDRAEIDQKVEELTRQYGAQFFLSNR